LALARQLWQAVHMPKNRHLSYSDRQADIARQKKQGQTAPQPVPAPASTPAPAEKPTPKNSKKKS
jgi:hypothetical protein